MPNRLHTPVPWHLGTDGNVYSGTTGGRLIATVDHNANGDDVPSSKPDNADLIVRAVNSHADLLAACEAVLEYTKQYAHGRLRGSDLRSLVEAAIAKGRGDLIHAER